MDKLEVSGGQATPVKKVATVASHFHKFDLTGIRDEHR